MALDLNNRNPTDPNGIYSFDTTAATNAWIKDGDWSQMYYSEAEARKAGATNKVRIAQAVTNDGRKFDVVVGADGQPISQIGDSRGYDDDQSRRWKEQQTQANRPPEERNNNGRRQRWNPQKSEWEDIGPSVDPSARQDSRTPEQQRKDAEDERERQWNQANGGLRETHTERREREAKEAQTASATQRQAEADGRARSAEQRAQEDHSRQQQQANQPRVTLTGDGSQAVLTYPDGRVETKPTGVQGKPDRLTLEGKIYERQADGSYVDKTPPAAPLPADAPRYEFGWSPGFGLFEYARAVRQRADIPKDVQDKLIAEAHQIATSTTSQAVAVLNAQQNAATTAAGQRNADVSRATSALGNATSSASSAAQNAAAMTKFSSGEGTVAALNGNMLRAAAMGQAFGGFAPTPHAPMGVATQQIMAAPIPGLPTLTGATGGPWGAAPAAAAAPPAAPAAPVQPAFRPMPPAQYPGAPGAPAAMPVAAPPAQAAPSVPTASSELVRGGHPQQQAPAINPVTGEPTGLSPLPVNGEFPAPVQMAPTLTGMTGSPWGAQQQPMAAAPPAGIGALGALAGGGLGWYDPVGLNRKLLEDGFDPEVVAMLGGAGVG